eukprot:CAMPEP_0118657604 /NCGR_PEP_ID=MMETSP0785-20121206/14110_1 /TAXON_ID=91992 /ORGANISM="Bolidomonas pacifica, Strain CCMP 1866" /LENGTH=33 /DNA_ID= /DNA_START= /DNA_END= /DNA_ORIENTATION=
MTSSSPLLGGSTTITSASTASPAKSAAPAVDVR